MIHDVISTNPFPDTAIYKFMIVGVRNNKTTLDDER